MSEKKKKSSIAQKLNGSWLRSLCINFLALDVLILTVGFVWWLLVRDQTVVLDQAFMLTFLKWGGGIVLVLQFLLWFRQTVSGYNRAKKILRPLNEMAQTAAELSQQNVEQVQQMEAKRFRAVEDAIGRISPDAPNARLVTGDSDLRGLENAVNDLLQRMHESYRQQVRFVSDASHELRTPIAVIQGYANMLDRWGKEDAVILDEGIQAIKSESDTMKRLVEQLLFLARGDSGRQPVRKEAVNLSELMHAVYEEFTMIDPEHEWRVETEEPLIVQGDDAMLKQAARILTENAAKYTPKEGLITLRTRRIDEKNAALEVSDQGIGIRREDVSHVFERFYRADPVRDRKTGGTGLGLSIAGWIAEQHSGYLTVVSYEDLGTRMRLILPLESFQQDQK